MLVPFTSVQFIVEYPSSFLIITVALVLTSVSMVVSTLAWRAAKSEKQKLEGYPPPSV